MKLVFFISFLLLLPLFSRGFEHGVTQTNQYTSGKIEESNENMMDYPPTGPNTPGRSRFRRHPPHPFMKKKDHGVASQTAQYSLNQVEESIPRMMDYMEPDPYPRHDPPRPDPGTTPPPPPPQQKN